MHLIGRLSVGLVVTFLASWSVVGQEGRRQRVVDTDQEYKLNVDVQLIQLPVSVVDKNGRSVAGLASGHFQVFEDGIPQQISVFKREDIPLSVGLVIDNSGSMHNKRERVNRAALTFARESNPADETFIINFGNEVYLEQDFTGSISNLIAALNNINTGGETALYDAVYLSIEHLRGGKEDKRAILLISDGEDNTSRYGMNRVLEALRQSEVTLYAIGLLDEHDHRGGLFRKSPSKKAKEVLRKFAEATGGRAYFPKSVEEAEHLCKRIAHDIRNQYTIGYSPLNKERNGSWRQIRVKVNPPQGFDAIYVRTKPGYYAPHHTPKTRSR